MNELFERLISLQDEHVKNLELYGIKYKDTTLYLDIEMQIVFLRIRINLTDALNKQFMP